MSLLSNGDTILVEGQFRNDTLHGFGRYIATYATGKYDCQIGFWCDGNL